MGHHILPVIVLA